MTTATQHLVDVKQYIDRPTLTDALVTAWTRMAEATMRRALKDHMRMRVRRLWPQPADKATLPLPTDLLALLTVRVRDLPLRQYSPGQEVLASANADGFIYRGDCLELYPAPIAQTNYTIDYQAALVSIFDAADLTNWVLTLHPDVYLYGTLEQGATYVRDVEAKAAWGAEFRGRLSELARQGWDEAVIIGGR